MRSHLTAVPMEQSESRQGDGDFWALKLIARAIRSHSWERDVDACARTSLVSSDFCECSTMNGESSECGMRNAALEWCRISWIRWAFHFAILQNPCQPMSIVMFSMDMEEAAHLFAAYSHSWCWFAAWFRGPWLHWAMLCKVGISISCLCLRIPWLV